LALALAALSPRVSGDEADRVRGMLYRVDGEANLVRQHPDAAQPEAMAAARYAAEAAHLAPQAEVVAEAADSLAVAAKRHNPVDVRERAIELQRLVRLADDALPPRGIAQ
jgi:hypothetical protein